MTNNNDAIVSTDNNSSNSTPTKEDRQTAFLKVVEPLRAHIDELNELKARMAELQKNGSHLVKAVYDFLPAKKKKFMLNGRETSACCSNKGVYFIKQSSQDELLEA